jgi:histone H3/H4
MAEDVQKYWRKCSSCKKPIALNARYYACSVSTCNGQRTGYVFCSVPCFERHVPGARHKDAAAIEMTAGARPDSAPAEDSASTSETNRAPQRTIIRSAGSGSQTASSSVSTSGTREVLVIASRLKEFIHARSEYNTSASVMDVLSDHLRNLCDRGIENARADGRRTVMDRDFDFLKK